MAQKRPRDHSISAQGFSTNMGALNLLADKREALAAGVEEHRRDLARA
jgi:hypothetical protein